MKHNLLQRIMFLLVCFGLTTLMSAQTVHQVAAGDNAIGDALLEAFAGDIIELTTSGGIYTDSATHEIMFDITIRAAEGLAQKPVIDGGTNQPVIEIIAGGITVQGIKFINGDYVLRSRAAETVNSSDFSLKVDNCEFHNWTQRAIHTRDDIWTPLDSVLVSNSIFMNGDEQAFYLKATRGEHGIFPGGYRYCKIENCLIAGLTSFGDGHATYIEPGNRDVGDQGWPEVIIDHVTVDNCESGISTYTTAGAIVQNCVVTNLTDPGKNCFDIQSGRWTDPELPPPSTLKNSIYSGGGLNLEGSSTVVGITENVDSVAPIFVDAANGNYALAEGSPGKGAGTDGKDLGFLGPYPVAAELPMVISPGFEEDTSFNSGAWGSDWDNSSINENASYVFSGSKSMKIGPGAGGRAQYPEVAAVGSTVSLLAWGIADGELNEPAWIGFVAIDEFGFETEAEGTSVAGPEMIPADEWTRLCASMTIPEGTVELRVYFWYSGDLVSDAASVYVDDYEFKWGDSCTVDTKVDPITYNSSINVYPNPTAGPVHISFGSDIVGATSLEIFDVTGKVISRVDDLMGREEVNIDLSSSPAGIYFGMLKSEGRAHTFKILKKN
jgi:hypothetical protein